jgi:hypothetical protein
MEFFHINACVTYMYVCYAHAHAHTLGRQFEKRWAHTNSYKTMIMDRCGCPLDIQHHGTHTYLSHYWLRIDNDIVDAINFTLMQSNGKHEVSPSLPALVEWANLPSKYQDIKFHR